jgi:hypothetical protein
MALVVGHRRGSMCGCLRPADASMACICKQGKAGTVGALLFVMALWGNGPPVTWTQRMRFCYMRTGRGAVDVFERE